MHRMAWRYTTRVGDFSVRQTPANRFVIELDGESLGSYHHPNAAADDLSGGHTFTPSKGVDTAELGIPENIQEWKRVS